MNKQPLISIILPVLNGEKFLSQAIDSVCSQTYQNWELIIVDNGSTDNTPRIIKSYTQTHKKIKSFFCSQEGIVHALNFGLQQAQGKIIARIDADDIWEKSKLYVQTHAMNENPHIALLGSSVGIIDDVGQTHPNQNAFNRGLHLTHSRIRKKLCRNNLFCHSSIVIKKEVIEQLGGYSDKYLHSEDYFLWFQTVQKYKAEILAERLVLFRYHPQSISRKFMLEQQKNSLKLRARFCFKMGDSALNILTLSIDFLKYYLKIFRDYIGYPYSFI